jgi:cysteine desulfurase
MLYLDHNATAPMRPHAIDHVLGAAERGGNPSSLHGRGQAARRELDLAKDAVRDLVGAANARVLLTSGGTEADHLAVRGIARAARRDRGADVVLLSDLEHPAVREAAAVLTAEGFRPRTVRVGADGRVDLEVFPSAAELRKTALVAVMLANNETGILQPVAEIAAVAREAGVAVHVDAVQAAGKVAIDFDALGVDALALSAHKFGGPRGVGALVTRPDLPLEALWGGGGQEEGLRSGTPAVPLAAGMGAAAREALADLRSGHGQTLRDRLEAALLRLEGAFGVGTTSPRLPNTSALGFEGVGAIDLVAEADRRGLCLGAGAACHAGETRVSTVLAAMGLGAPRALEVVRLSVGWNTTEADVDAAIGILTDAVSALRAAA